VKTENRLTDARPQPDCFMQVFLFD